MNVTKVQDRKEAYDVLTIDGSFDKAYPSLKKERVQLATTEQIARVRRFSGSDSSLSRNYGQWVAEAHIYQPIKSGVLALARPMKKGMLSSSEANPFEVSVDELAENPYFAFTLRDEAKPYGQFLKSAGISKVPVYLVSESNTKASE